jgi:hypothetical protein
MKRTLALLALVAVFAAPIGAARVWVETLTIDGSETTTETLSVPAGVRFFLFCFDSGFDGVAFAITTNPTDPAGTFVALEDPDGDPVALVAEASKCVSGGDLSVFLASTRYLRGVADSQTGATTITVLMRD